MVILLSSLSITSAIRQNPRKQSQLFRNDDVCLSTIRGICGSLKSIRFSEICFISLSKIVGNRPSLVRSLELFIGKVLYCTCSPRDIGTRSSETNFDRKGKQIILFKEGWSKIGA